MTRHEPAGLPKAAAADTVTGRSELSGGRACLRGAKAPDRWDTGPALYLSRCTSEALLPCSRLCAFRCH